MLSLDRGGDLILYEVERPSSLSHSCAGQMAFESHRARLILPRVENGGSNPPRGIAGLQVRRRAWSSGISLRKSCLEYRMVKFMPKLVTIFC